MPNTSSQQSALYGSAPPDIPGADEIIEEVKGKHAHPSVIKHALYGVYFNRKSIRYMARMIGKAPSTVHSWIKRWEADRLAGRVHKDPQFRKFGPDHRAWIKEYFEKYPLSFIDEAAADFEKVFNMTISHSHLWTILAESGFTRKVLEKRAREIRRDDVVRFINELKQLNWSPTSLVFLDEVSFDSRDMRRRYGYSPRGQKLVVRGDTNRSQRISLLCFQGVDGLLEAYVTEGTFTRAVFFEKLREFALSGIISPYPSPRSIWIMDGAKIHCDPAIVNYLRTLGIHVIYLPAYCPFFNPIESMFSSFKARMRRHYKDGAIPFSELPKFVASIAKDMMRMDMRGYFEAAGYGVANCFDSSRGWSEDIIDVTCRGGDPFDETDLKEGDGYIDTSE